MDIRKSVIKDETATSLGEKPTLINSDNAEPEPPLIIATSSRTAEETAAIANTQAPHKKRPTSLAGRIIHWGTLSLVLSTICSAAIGTFANNLNSQVISFSLILLLFVFWGLYNVLIAKRAARTKLGAAMHVSIAMLFNNFTSISYGVLIALQGLAISKVFGFVRAQEGTMTDLDYRRLLVASISATAYGVPVLLIATLLIGMHTLSRFYVWAASADKCQQKVSKRFARYSGWLAGLAMGISGLWMAVNVGGPAQTANPLHIFQCMSTAHLIWAVGALISLTFLNDVRIATEKE